MLKITIKDFPGEQGWSRQGRLVAEWTDELSATWREQHQPSDKRRCIVELGDLTFIDRDGEVVLTETMSQGLSVLLATCTQTFARNPQQVVRANWQ